MLENEDLKIKESWKDKEKGNSNMKSSKNIKMAPSAALIMSVAQGAIDRLMCLRKYSMIFSFLNYIPNDLNIAAESTKTLWLQK